MHEWERDMRMWLCSTNLYSYTIKWLADLRERERERETEREEENWIDDFDILTYIDTIE